MRNEHGLAFLCTKNICRKVQGWSAATSGCKVGAHWMKSSEGAIEHWNSSYRASGGLKRRGLHTGKEAGNIDGQAMWHDVRANRRAPQCRISLRTIAVDSGSYRAQLGLRVLPSSGFPFINSSLEAKSKCRCSRIHALRA